MGLKQKHFSARFEIQGEDPRLPAPAPPGKIEEAIKLEEKIKELLDEASRPETPGHMFEILRNKAQGLRETADRARRAHLIIMDEVIPQLMRTLAAFDTKTFSFMPDNAVVTQK